MIESKSKNRFALSVLLCMSGCSSAAWAFCGFYVAKADANLFNQASQVVMVRDDEKTVITMVNDYRGEAKEFAMVVPVPEVLKRKQINVGDPKVIEHLDAYTAPRLVEYFDPNPCDLTTMRYGVAEKEAGSVGKGAGKPPLSADMGVTVEAKYQVGEYDILILSAKESDGLLRWLKANGYKMPKGAKGVLKSYISRDLKFFVAKVNLQKKEQTGYAYLRPLQIAFESKRFELPIRLGTVNADGPQDLLIYALTRKGRVETYNYRTVKIPSNVDLPVHLKKDFKSFYKDMFSHQVEKDDMRVVYQEYAWDMGWCDPCAADPLSPKELRQLGAFWVKQEIPPKQPKVVPMSGQILPPSPQPRDVFVTRLHVRYDKKTFPSDLQFQVTNDRTNFQGRYVLRHAFTGEMSCEASQRYTSQLGERREKEAQTLAQLTGWDINDIRKAAKMSPTDDADKKKDGSWLDDVFPGSP